MDQECNGNLLKVLDLSAVMLCLANEGDTYREDVGCGVLYGMLRDYGYKIRILVEAEIAEHKKRGDWPEEPERLERDKAMSYRWV